MDISSETPEQPDANDLENLSYQDLQEHLKEVSELAARSFTQTQNGFKNALDEGVYVAKYHETFKLSEISPTLRAVHAWMALNPDSILTKGSTNKEEMMTALKAMLEEIGNRVIR